MSYDLLAKVIFNMAAIFLGFGEEKWIDYIADFRKKYEEGKIEGRIEAAGNMK